MADFDSIKDKVVGKVKETAGKVTNDEKLEAKGKAQAMKGEAEDKVDKAKHDVSKKTDNLADKAAEKFNDTVDAHRDHQ